AIIVIRSVIIDSQLSFNVSRFHSIDVYTVIGLITLSLIAGLVFMVSRLINSILHNLIRNSWIETILVVLTSAGSLFLAYRQENVLLFSLATLWLLVLLLLLDVPKLRISKSIFSAHMIFWLVFVCATTTLLLQYFIGKR